MTSQAREYFQDAGAGARSALARIEKLNRGELLIPAAKTRPFSRPPMDGTLRGAYEHRLLEIFARFQATEGTDQSEGIGHVPELDTVLDMFPKGVRDRLDEPFDDAFWMPHYLPTMVKQAARREVEDQRQAVLEQAAEMGPEALAQARELLG